MAPQGFDAIVLAGFGGPENPGDVEPFVARILEGRDVPASRQAEVVAHYKRVHPDGVSPYNRRTREQAAALSAALAEHGIATPVRVAYRNTPPSFDDVLKELHEGGARRILAIVLAVHRGSASIGRYIDELERAREKLGDPSFSVEYAEPFFDHPLFIAAQAKQLQEARRRLDLVGFDNTEVIFTAHSIPLALANQDTYAQDVERTASLVATALELTHWSIAYQSRSGRRSVPWLEPDIADAIRSLPEKNIKTCVVVPIGFLCDHVEVLYDLDVDAANVARESGIRMERASAVNADPLFIAALADMVALKCA